MDTQDNDNADQRVKFNESIVSNTTVDSKGVQKRK